MHMHEVVSVGPDYCYDARTPDAGPAAGNIEFEEICSCGARRWVAVNQRHRDEGPWGPTRQQRIDAAHAAVLSAPLPDPLVRPDGLRASVDAAGYVLLSGPHTDADAATLPASWLAAARRRREAVAALREVQS